MRVKIKMAKTTTTKTSKKKEFEKDDYVVYPMHGVGQIVDIAGKIVLNKRKKYYIIELINTKMKVMVPIDTALDVGLRHIIQKREVTKVLNLLKEEYEEVDEEWKIRYQNNLAKIKSGSIMQVGEVTRNLYKRARDKELSIMERKLYENAYSLVINEVALAKGVDLESASSLISDILSN